MQHGYYAWQNAGLAVASLDEVAQLFVPLVGDLTQRKYITRLGRFEFTRVRDMRAPGHDSLYGAPNLPVSDAEMLSFYSPELYVSIRPSGTEPKVKYYIEACSPESQAKALLVAREFETELLALIAPKK